MIAIACIGTYNINNTEPKRIIVVNAHYIYIMQFSL